MINVHSAGTITPPKLQDQPKCMNSEQIFPICSSPKNIIDIFQGHGTDPPDWIMLCG